MNFGSHDSAVVPAADTGLLMGVSLNSSVVAKCLHLTILNFLNNEFKLDDIYALLYFAALPDHMALVVSWPDYRVLRL